MARLKICRACDRQNSPTEPFCLGCGSSLAGVPLASDPPVSGSERAGGPAEPDSAGRAGPEATELEADGSRATLVFEQGEIPVPPEGSGSVRIGRDPRFSPHASWFTDEQTVSHEHAEVFMKDGYTWVRHFSRTNPTYHNDDPIKDYGREEQLADGDELKFSRHVTAKVRLG